MPWIILHANGEELSRHELTAPVAIGRSPECDIAVKDIMLSRTHCRIEPAGGDSWKLVDLGSRNGTRVGWDVVAVHVLRDGDHVRMGRTRMIYFAGAFVPPPHGRRAPDPDRVVRPADPHEALSGTVTDFVLLDDEDADRHPDSGIDDDGLPSPQPRPFDDQSCGSPGVESLLNELASSGWARDGQTEREYPSSSALDQGAGVPQSVAHDPSQTALLSTMPVRARPLPRIVINGAVYREVPQRLASEVDLSLQADEASLADLELAPPADPRPGRTLLATTGLVLAAALGTAIMFMSLWLLTVAP